jgi:hypothetical protein
MHNRYVEPACRDTCNISGETLYQEAEIVCIVAGVVGMVVRVQTTLQQETGIVQYLG